MYEPDEIEKERKRRIDVAIWAYAYEIKDDPLVSDAEFDRVCNEINLDIDTGNYELDFWFRHNFQPHTGQWIHIHPHRKRLEELYEKKKQWMENNKVEK